MNDTHTTRRAGRRGFTLTEVMIAMGVLVVGMGMAAGAFYAGIQNHTTTVDDIMRTLVGENAVAIAKARLRHPNSGITAMLSPLAVGPADRKFPVGFDTGHGYLMLAVQRQTGQAGQDKPNDHEFLVIPYTTPTPTNVVSTTTVTNALISDTDTGVSQIRVFKKSDRLKLPVGAKIVEYNAADPEQKMKIATVAGTVGSSAVLLDVKIATGTRNLTVLEVRDKNGNPVTDEREMPEFSDAFSVRTALLPGE